MEDKVLSERDVHVIVKILQKSSTLINDLHVLRGALGLTLAEHDEIARRVQMDRSGTYLHLCLVLNKWIELNGNEATVRKLALILTEQNFHLTAGELLRTLEGMGMSNTGNDKKEEKSTMVKRIDEPDQVSFQKLSMNEIQSIHMTERAEFSQGLASSQLTRSADDTKPIAIPSSSKVDSKPGQRAGESTDLNRKSSQIRMTELKISGEVQMYGFWNWLKKDKSVLRSQAEFNQLLKLAPEKFSALKMIEFDRIEINWSEFWDCVEPIKTLDTIQLINLKILPFIPTRRVLLPNLRRYILKLDMNSSDVVRRTLEQSRETSAEVMYLVEYLIPFVKDNLAEDIWSTCLGLKCVRLDLVIPSEVTFSIDKDNLELKVDRIFVEYRQYWKSTQSSILPQFLQSFHELKKLMLTNECGILGYIDFSSFPSSLTHLRLYDSPKSIRDRDLDVALKTCRGLVYLNVSDPNFSTTKHTIDLAYLSPEIRCLRLGNTSITCSSHCQFNHWSVLILYGSYFQSSVNVPSIFRYVKKCFFGGFNRWSDPPFTLKEWLEMDALEFIYISGLEIDKGDEVRGILTNCGVPPNAETFSLERNGKKRWQLFVSESGLSAWEIFDQALTQAWNDTLK